MTKDAILLYVGWAITSYDRAITEYGRAITSYGRAITS